MEQRELRYALGNFATGVTIVTSRLTDGSPVGMTANSFSSVSLDPPLILFSMDRQALSLSDYEAAGCFAVNVLSREQEGLSTRFARASGDKWSGIEYEIWETGSPVLPGSLVSFDCTTWQTYDGGDHVIFVGRVVHASSALDSDPLLFFRGQYRGVASQNDASQNDAG